MAENMLYRGSFVESVLDRKIDKEGYQYLIRFYQGRQEWVKENKLNNIKNLLNYYDGRVSHSEELKNFHPKKIIKRAKHPKGEIYCLVELEPFNNLPTHVYVNIEIMKSHFPILLIEFYETNLHFE
jgi:hypothetical protein